MLCECVYVCCQGLSDTRGSARTWSTCGAERRRPKKGKGRGDTRKTETDKDGDRQRQRDRETAKKRDRETERQRDRETERQRERGAMFRHVQRGVQRCAKPTESADLELTEWPAAQSAQQSAQ
jgi:hypothetical protein